ncbi:GNAT family N-acetyltransferase [Nocardioides mangrovicus]|uniref:GNAT family N-acetyltransferase n=1 Tax=Nocardioides mangrovicus TaxID=2478913 RepID=A0A3L8P4V1_9ACTN|nr:GNAT family N-acetyltransferase [Nocardioides mangrovicus]RLV50027.1 GNAT family N-acetyltransferase [Nocardioides mangrovicus]
MTTFPILVDPDGATVVSLRRHTEADTERVYEQCVDPLSVEFTTVPVPYTRGMARSFVTEAMPGGWESDQEWAFAVDVDGRFGGTVSLRNEGDGRAEIAYGSHPDVRGTGAMERALRLLLGWGFDTLRLQAVVWWADRGNWASRRLAWKLGFSFDGTVRGYLPQRGGRHDGWVGMLLAGEERSPRYPWFEVPTIEGERVRLRAPREDDSPRVVELENDPLTRRWNFLPEQFGDAEARAGLLRAREEMALGERLLFAAADPADDRFLGDVSLFRIHRAFGSAMLGYSTHPDARGRGLTGEAVRLALRHAFVPADEGGLGLLRVAAGAAVDNVASIAVLRRAGMREIGLERRGVRTGEGMSDALRFEALAD